MMVTNVGWPKEGELFRRHYLKNFKENFKVWSVDIDKSKAKNEVFNCFGIHSSFDTVAMPLLSFYLILSAVLLS